MIRKFARRVAAFWNGWVTFFGRREPGTALALFRIAVGLCVAAEIGGTVLCGVSDAVWLDARFGGYRSLEPNWLVAWLGGAAPGTVKSLIGVCLAASAALALGWHARLAAFVCLQAFVALVTLNRDVVSSYTLLMSNALWLLVLARSAQTLSLDCRRRTGAWTDATPVPAWPRYLAGFQVLLMYFSSGLHKVGSDWPLGGGLSAIYYTLQQPAWQRFGMEWLAWIYPLTQAATLVSWVWELAAPVWLVALYFDATPERDSRARRLFRRLRMKFVFVTLGIAFHLQILIFMRVGNFSFISLAYYLCLLRPKGDGPRSSTGTQASPTGLATDAAKDCCRASRSA